MSEELKDGLATEALEAAEADAKLIEGIDPAFHEIVRRYGRSMFALVMNAGMAQQGSVF